MALRPKVKLKPGSTGELLLNQRTQTFGAPNSYDEIRQQVEIVKPEAEKDWQFEWKQKARDIVPGSAANGLQDVIVLDVKREFVNRTIFAYIGIDTGVLTSWTVDASIRFYLDDVLVGELPAVQANNTDANQFATEPGVNLIDSQTFTNFGQLPYMRLQRKNTFNHAAEGIQLQGFPFRVTCERISYFIYSATVGIVGADLFLGCLSIPPN